MLELLWYCVVAAEALFTSVRAAALPQWNRGLPANWVSKPPDEQLSVSKADPL
jgi:hypothetical protein